MEIRKTSLAYRFASWTEKDTIDTGCQFFIGLMKSSGALTILVFFVLVGISGAIISLLGLLGTASMHLQGIPVPEVGPAALFQPLRHGAIAFSLLGLIAGMVFFLMRCLCRRIEIV